MLLWVLLVARPTAAAAPARHALHWVRAEGAERCIDPRELAERIEALTGPAFVTPAQAEISLEGEIVPAGRGFRARIVSTDAAGAQSGERVLTSASPDCRALDPAIAFVIALTIDPGLSLSGQAAAFLAEFAQELPPEQALLAELASHAAQPAPERDVLAEGAPAAPQPTPRAPPPRRPTRYALQLGAATLGRSLPEWMFGVRGGFTLDHARLWPLVLNASAFPSGRSQELADAAAAAIFQAYDAALSVCPRVHWRALGAHGCAGLALAYLHARGSGFERNHSAAMWDPALVAGGALTLALGRGWGFGADALLRVRLTDQRFASAAAGGESRTAHRPPRVGFLFSLGPRYEF